MSGMEKLGLTELCPGTGRLGGSSGSEGESRRHETKGAAFRTVACTAQSASKSKQRCFPESERVPSSERRAWLYYIAMPSTDITKGLNERTICWC